MEAFGAAGEGEHPTDIQLNALNVQVSLYQQCFLLSLSLSLSRSDSLSLSTMRPALSLDSRPVLPSLLHTAADLDLSLNNHCVLPSPICPSLSLNNASHSLSLSTMRPTGVEEAYFTKD
jgi:hypothetical protein